MNILEKPYEIHHVENIYQLMVGITSETLALLQQLPNFRVVKGNQNGNEVAHSLARFCREESSCGVLLSSIPHCV